MLELHIANTNLSDSNVSVGWCVDKATLEMIAAKGWKDPVIVFITAPVKDGARGKEYRKVASLKDHIAYLEFRSHGENNIFAFISKDAKLAKSYFLSGNESYYHCDLIKEDGSDWLSSHFIKSEINRANTISLIEEDVKTLLSKPLSVIVPENVFAAPPAEWEKTWVNWVLGKKSIDQCSFRRKRLFAYTLQIPIFLFMFCNNIILYLAALGLGLNIFTNLSYLNILSSDITLYAENIGGIFSSKHFLIKPINDPEDENFLKQVAYNIFAFLITTPLVFIALYLLWKAHFIIGIVKFLGLALVGIGTVVGGGFLISYMLDKRSAAKDKLPIWYMEQENTDLIVCSPNKKITSINDLPSNKKTIWLRFQDLKSKVCRPYSA